MENCKVSALSFDATDIEEFGGLNQLSNLPLLASISLHSCSNCSVKSNIFWENAKEMESLSLINCDIRDSDILDCSFKEIKHLTIIDCGNIHTGNAVSFNTQRIRDCC